ncbi:MAG: Bcr/CflA family efflux MFS transporter [Alphaproteobacteria bacterium]|nr:Bcr/CflA family efflux MFS transporter [Alphaproteobacteria bacterium]
MMAAGSHPLQSMTATSTSPVPPSDGLAIDNRTLFIAALIGAASIGSIGMHLFVPSIPFITREFQSDPAVTQLAFSLSMMAMAIATIVFGPLSDRFGRRIVLHGGLVLFLVGTALCAIAPSVDALIVGRVVQAAGGASGMVLTRAVVRDVYGPERSASLFAYLTMAMLVAPLIAQNVGGLLTDHIGWRYAFWLSFGCGTLVAALMMRGMPETHRTNRASIAPLALARNYGRLLRSPVFGGYALHSAFAAATFFAFMGAAPVLMVEALGRPVFEYTLFFLTLSLTFMVANGIAGRISIRFGISRMVWFGGLFSLTFAFAMLTSLWAWGLNPYTLFLPTAMVGVGNGFSMPSANAGAINVDPKLSGTAAGLNAFLTMGLGATFIQLVAVMADGSAWPVAALILGGTLLSVAAGAVPWWLQRRGSPA